MDTNLSDYFDTPPAALHAGAGETDKRQVDQDTEEARRLTPDGSELFE